MSMMDTVLALRPANDGSVALREAIERATASLAELERDAEALAAERDALLFTGKPAAIEAKDAALAERAEEIRRVRHMLLQMQEKLDAAASREADQVAAIAARQASLNALSAEFWRQWQGYREHAEAIAKMLQLGQQVKECAFQLAALVNAAQQRGNLGFDYSGLPAEARFLMAPGDRSIFDMVSLPAPDGSFFHGGAGTIWMSPATARRFSELKVPGL